MQIDSQSVSRNHAMLLKGARELIVEDLNSTNGVLVNGRKVSRQVLSDGDVLTIGETQFRCVLKFNSRSADSAAPVGFRAAAGRGGEARRPRQQPRAAGPDAAQPSGTAPAGDVPAGPAGASSGRP